MKFKEPICKSQLSFHFVFFALLLAATQSGFAQTAPLNFENNFFVTGDYIVAGASGMTTKFTTINGVSYALGTIAVPDTNPGIMGVKQVPVGAQIVAALLYWQTVEKVGVTPGGPGSGQNGFFRPLLYSKTGGPAAPGYAISGTNVTGSKAVSWSSGGCGGTSTGKQLVTYRADVAGGLPNDANGNPTLNGNFEIRLPSVGSNSTPITLGATLVVIYRIPSGAGGPNIPLNSIVIYDGDYSQSNVQLTMTQKLQGFYDADHNAVSRLTHIVGNGQSNKFQTVYLSSGANSFVKLPLLYGNKLPAFPGWYGTWDNPTWTFTNASTTNPGVLEDASSATTQVVPSMSNQGCVSWGAIIMSTTVKNPDNDGILYSWKTNQGYCDASSNGGTCGGRGDPAWVDLTGSAHGQQDVFLQYDYMCSTVNNGSCPTGDNNYSFDPRLAVDPADGQTAVDKVVKSYANLNGTQRLHPAVVLHAIPGNAILENQPNIVCGPSDTDPSGPPGNLTCPFPNQAGTVGFRFGVENIKNYSIDTQTGRVGECTLGSSNTCAPVFQTAKKDSYHYALFSHGVGVPNWFLFDQSLSSVTQKGSTVTFTTPLPHGIKHIAGDTVCTSGRVTVLFAVTNPNLNGTFCIRNVNAAGTTFDITVPGSPTSTTVSYPANAEPYLGVADGQVTSMSGFSDVGGENVVVALGYGGWGPANNPTSDGNKWQTKAGTLMHELGHNMGLTHGGTFYNKIGNTPADYTPSFEANCKPNVQTSMSYMFQFDLMQVPSVLSAGKPLMVVDYSEDDGSVPTLTEGSPQVAGVLRNLPYANTASFQLPTNNSGAPHCDGTPLGPNEKSLTYVQFSPASDFFWSSATGFDINFDGKTTDVMHAHNEWTGTAMETGVPLSPGVDLRQISAIGTLSTSGAGGGHLSGGGGGGHLSGGGGGGHLSGGGGGGHLSGGGGGGHLSGGGGSPSEFTHEAANSYARPPRELIITQEEASPRLIDLSWFEPTFGTPLNYKIYSSAATGPFALLTTIPGTQTTFTDTVTCNSGGYHYRVTAVVNNDASQPQESVPTNTVPATGEPLLTGCYTAPVTVAVQAIGVQGDIVPVTWTLTDDSYSAPPAPWSSATPGNPVTNQAANTLVAVGPNPTNGCAAGGRTTLLLKGVAQSVNGTPAGTFGNSGDQFTYTLNTDVLCAGSYSFELDLDSGQTFTSSTLQLSIDINDQDTPRITTLALPPATVGLAYTDTLTEEGGTAPFKWTVTGLPTGISQQPVNSATFSGTACVANTYPVTATVTDSATPKNSGMQGFTLQVNKANTTTSVTSNANLSVFQQMVTFTVTVAPQYSCTPTGTVSLFMDGTLVGSTSLSNGTAVFAAPTQFNPPVGVHSFTATYGGDANFNVSNNNSAPWSQTVNQAITQVAFNSLMPATQFVGQPITVSYTFGVMAPGAGAPIPPSGNIIVTATDNANPVPHTSSCMAAAYQGAGMCTLSPAPTVAGTYSYTISYPGDGNFVAGGANGNYNVYQLVFTTQPSNTGVALAINPAVVVTAEDSSNATVTSFTGGITVAIGSGPGTLSGTLALNAVGGAARFNDLNINKIANAYTLTAAPSGGVPDATSSPFNIDTFYVDASGNFGTLDLPTGKVTQIGAATVPNSTGIDLTSGLQVYGYNTSGQLFQIAPTNGAATPVGGPGSIPDQATTGALTNGSYFGIDAVTGNLYSIDTSAGATTLVGLTSAPVLPAGCTLDSSLTGSATVLYYTVGYSGASCTSPMSDTLYQINPTSGATTTIGPVTISNAGVNAFVGSTFVGGTLYGFTSGGQEYTINPATGAATSPVNTTPTTAIIGAGSQ